MENSFNNLISPATSVTVLLPTNPNLDQVAAGLSLYLALKDKKEINISCPSPMIVEFNRLVGIDKISSELGNKNLTIRFSNYEATDIERVSYDIENGQFKLTVIPKPGFVSPKQDQVEMSYSGTSGGTVVIIGGETDASFPALSSKDLVDAKVIHVGVKALPGNSEHSVMSFARPASSICEIVYTLISETDTKIDSDIATNLLAGIESVSNGFSSDGVSAETFEIVAHLLRLGGQRLLKNQFTQQGGPIIGEQLYTNEPEKKEQTPQEWLTPKVYKGTSIS